MLKKITKKRKERSNIFLIIIILLVIGLITSVAFFGFLNNIETNAKYYSGGAGHISGTSNDEIISICEQEMLNDGITDDMVCTHRCELQFIPESKATYFDTNGNPTYGYKSVYCCVEDFKDINLCEVLR